MAIWHTADTVHAAAKMRRLYRGVAHGLKGCSSPRSAAGFQFQDAALRPHARRLDGFLQAHAVVNQV